MKEIESNQSPKHCRAPAEDGQTIIEYGLILAFVSVVMVASLSVYQNGLSAYVNGIVERLLSLI